VQGCHSKCMLSIDADGAWRTCDMVFLRRAAICCIVSSNGCSPGSIWLKRMPRGPTGRRSGEYLPVSIPAQQLQAAPVST